LSKKFFENFWPLLVSYYNDGFAVVGFAALFIFKRALTFSQQFIIIKAARETDSQNY